MIKIKRKHEIARMREAGRRLAGIFAQLPKMIHSGVSKSGSPTSICMMCSPLLSISWAFSKTSITRKGGMSKDLLETIVYGPSRDKEKANQKDADLLFL